MDFEILDESGVAMELVGFRFAVLAPQPPTAGLYCEDWVETQRVTDQLPATTVDGMRAVRVVLE